jgi:hypothetical protein
LVPRRLFCRPGPDVKASVSFGEPQRGVRAKQMLLLRQLLRLLLLLLQRLQRLQRLLRLRCACCACPER